MSNSLTKKLWILFSERFGSSIIHPQHTLIKYQKEAIEEAKKHAKGKLVDIGCGRMPYRKELEPFVDSYTGVDHPNVSKLYSPQNTPDILADAKKLPLKTNSFETALLIQVLEHVDSPEEVIKEASRVLKENGTLIISVPFLYPLHDMPYDWGRYTASALKSFARNASLRIIKFEQQGNFFEFWLQMLNTFLVKRIHDIINTKLSLTSVVLLVFLIIISVPMILINNLVMKIVGFVCSFFPEYPNHFPLEYLMVAKKNHEK